MKKREFGSTGKKTSLIGLGGGQFAGSEHSVEEIKEIVQTALDNGVNFIDTARDYGEDRLGEALKRTEGEYFISSKTLAKNKEDALEDVHRSLKKLNQDKIDFYFMHNPMSVEDYRHRKREGVLEALKKAREQGLVDCIGISCDYVEPLELAVEDNVDVIMPHYNVGNTLAEDIIEKSSNRGVGVVAAKSFAGGILVDSKPGVEEGKENEMTPDKSLKFTLSNENISTVLVGARYPWQIKECAEVGKNFDPEEVDQEKIKKHVFDFLGNNFCRDCRYCWPCEELGYEFDIPEILRFLDRYEKYGFKRFSRIEFSKLPYKEKINDAGKCDFECPFGIDVLKRLKTADEKLELEVSQEQWIEKLREKQGEVNNKTVQEINFLKELSKNEAIEKIHSELIPSGKVDEKLGILLIEGIHSFGVEEVLENLEVPK
ncbi:MAG: aldo/keto reductase [Candidatus Aenigmatarchaeota archaeon]